MNFLIIVLLLSLQMFLGLGRSTIFCPKAIHCKNVTKYRNINGNCNNLKHSNWGESNTAFLRLLPPKYSDGISQFRESVEGGPLPGARELSNKLTLQGEVTMKGLNATVIFMQWGQLIAHDITFSAPGLQNENCCKRSPDGAIVRDTYCKPIRIPSGDPFYSQFNQTCLNFERDMAALSSKCNIGGKREQINQNTAYMDASFLYGSNDEISNILRSYKNGELVVTELNGREFFPSDKPENCAFRVKPRAKCPLAGDSRVNIVQGLTLLQLLFLREHNRVAKVLHDLNPDWNDEIIFQEARRIIIAEMQYITYNEWVPNGIGPDPTFLAQYDLLLEPSGYSSKYNPEINPGISNEFTAAGFRFHSVIPGFYNMMNSKGQLFRQLHLRNIYNDPSNLYPKNAIHEGLEGLTQQISQAFDNIFSEDITNYFDSTKNAPFGSDLLAIDIQRGRDHGLPTYNDIREYCGLPRVKNFEDLNNYLRPGSAQKFAEIYKNVDDIDFVIAGQQENFNDVGVMFSISAEQFRRTKLGDRFWFENGNMVHSFSIEQLNEIRKASVASLLCQNGDDIRVMQLLAFEARSEMNPLTDCSKIPKINLEYWKNEKI